MIFFLLSKESIIQLLSDEGVIWFYLSQKDDIVKSYSMQCLGNMCIRYCLSCKHLKNYNNILRIIDEFKII